MRTRLRDVLLCALCLGVTGNVLADEAKPAPPVWKTLRPFKNTAEFDDYRRRVHDAAKKNGLWWASMRLGRRGEALLAQTADPAPCDPGTDDCVVADELSEVTVTGLRASRSSSQSSSSITNNQVAGVDEADFVKNDGQYIYAVANGALRIVQAWPAANASFVTKVAITGTPKKLFVEGDRALVYVSVDKQAKTGSSYGQPSYYGQSSECTYGYECIPSEANFFMVEIGREIQPVIEEFRGKKVMVGRPFPPMTTHMRVSVGTAEEMDRFMKAFKEIFPAKTRTTAAGA